MVYSDNWNEYIYQMYKPVTVSLSSKFDIATRQQQQQNSIKKHKVNLLRYMFEFKKEEEKNST